jgi:hypothetical protein
MLQPPRLEKEAVAQKGKWQLEGSQPAAAALGAGRVWTALLQIHSGKAAQQWRRQQQPAKCSTDGQCFGGTSSTSKQEPQD